MSYYGGTVTVAGRDLITSLVAGETIQFTRIMVGSGALPEGAHPIDMTELVAPVAEGTSTTPVQDGGTVYMTIEYRSDLNGGLKEGFWLREFGVYAKTAETEEILLYYATLGDSPQPVNPLKDGRVDIRRYPISISLALDLNVQVMYNPGAFVSSADAQKIIEQMVNEKIKSVSCSVSTTITIPVSWWAEVGPGTGEEDHDEYRYYIDVPIPGVDESNIVHANPNKASYKVAGRAGVCRAMYAGNGYVRCWSERIPDADIVADAEWSLQYYGIIEAGDGYTLPVATETTLGGVKIGPGVEATEDGTLSVDTASDSEVEEMLDEIFPTDETDGE